jgi:hypothetical protein
VSAWETFTKGIGLEQLFDDFDEFISMLPAADVASDEDAAA